MLVVSRKVDQVIYIGPDIVLTVVSIEPGKVRLGITAPQGTNILRDDAINREPPPYRHRTGRDVDRDVGSSPIV